MDTKTQKKVQKTFSQNVKGPGSTKVMQGIKGAKLEQKCASYIPKIEKAVKDGNTKLAAKYKQQQQDCQSLS